MQTEAIDPQSEAFLAEMGEQQRLKANKAAGVRTVLVVLSARGIIFDAESLRQKILLSYPDAAVFFQTTRGKPIGAKTPSRVDLVIDFTGPGSRQGLCFARRLRKMARVAVGRNASFLRKRIYDRVFDELAPAGSRAGQPADSMERERFAQKQVLALAGVYFNQPGEALPDRSKTIALELPPLRKS